MFALVDGDILVYRVGFSCQSTTPEGEVVASPLGIAFARLDESMQNFFEALKVDAQWTFLTSTDKSNFRYSIYPEYKANRKAPKPLLYDDLRAYFMDKYKAVEVSGQEADDEIGIVNAENPDKGIICSIDKDLDQLPGIHYNWVRGLKYTVTPEEGLKKFYHQLLMGDRTDNIPGLTGIGEVRARKALERATTESHLFSVAEQMYKKEFPDTWESEMLRNGRLLKIRQKKDELWDIPVDKQPVQTEPQETSVAD